MQRETIVVAYHEDCIDGFTSAFLTYRSYELLAAFGKGIYKVLLVPVNYATGYQTLKEALASAITVTDLNVTLIIVDFSYTEDQLYELIERFDLTAIHMVDHHKSAAESWNHQLIYSNKFTITIGRINVMFDMTKCGAGIVYHEFLQYLRRNAAPKEMRKAWERYESLVKYVQEYDLWTKNCHFVDEIHEYLELQDKTIKAWDLANDTINYALERAVARGAGVLAYKKKQVEAKIATAVSITLAGHTGLIANAPYEYASSLGHELAKLSGTFGATWFANKTHLKFSLRSQRDFDVSAICKVFGGGGHKNSAGFAVPIDQEYLLTPFIHPEIKESLS